MFLSIHRHKLFVSFQRVSKKIFNIIMLFALILPNFAGVITAKAASEQYTTSSHPVPSIEVENSYQAPVFEHPEASLGTHLSQPPQPG
mgnify:CR=1 FL=1